MVAVRQSSLPLIVATIVSSAVLWFVLTIDGVHGGDDLGTTVASKQVVDWRRGWFSINRLDRKPEEVFKILLELSAILEELQASTGASFIGIPREIIKLSKMGQMDPQMCTDSFIFDVDYNLDRIAEEKGLGHTKNSLKLYSREYGSKFLSMCAENMLKEWRVRIQSSMSPEQVSDLDELVGEFIEAVGSTEANSIASPEFLRRSHDKLVGAMRRFLHDKSDKIKANGKKVNYSLYKRHVIKVCEDWWQAVSGIYSRYPVLRKHYDFTHEEGLHLLNEKYAICMYVCKNRDKIRKQVRESFLNRLNCFGNKYLIA